MFYIDGLEDLFSLFILFTLKKIPTIKMEEGEEETIKKIVNQVYSDFKENPLKDKNQAQSFCDYHTFSKRQKYFYIYLLIFLIFFFKKSRPSFE